MVRRNLPDVAKHLEDYNQSGIPESETLISTTLKNAGYTTGCVGKWHLGSSPPFHPNTRGFDEFFGFVGGGHQYYPSISDKIEPKINDYQYFLEHDGEDILSPEGAYLTDMLSNDAVRFIDTHSQSPFFLYLAYNAPHSPLQGKTEDLQHLYPDHTPTDPKNGVNYRDYEPRQNYVAMLYAVDRGVGQLVETLRKNSIEENTLIVFTSDNGGKILQAANNSPLQDDKGSTLEGGIRVPMFMHWPGKIPPGQIYDHPTLLLDLYPTFAKLANASLPKDQILDGIYIWDALLANEDARPNEPMFWLRHHGAGNEIAIRKGIHKAYRKNYSSWKLYDVSTDLEEQTDLAKTHSEILNQLIEKGRQWSNTHQAPLWHDTQGSLDSWNENSMPQYDESFRKR